MTRDKTRRVIAEEWVSSGAITRENWFVPRDSVFLFRPGDIQGLPSLYPPDKHGRPSSPEALVHPETLAKYNERGPAALVASVLAGLLEGEQV